MLDSHSIASPDSIIASFSVKLLCISSKIAYSRTFDVFGYFLRVRSPFQFNLELIWLRSITNQAHFISNAKIKKSTLRRVVMNVKDLLGYRPNQFKAE